MTHFITKEDLMTLHRVSEKDADSLMFYKKSHYEVMNHYLRTGIFVKTGEIPTLELLKEHIDNIKRCMYPLRNDMIVYRGVPSDTAKTEDNEFPDLSFMLRH